MILRSSDARLEASTDMTPVHGSVDVAIPLPTLWPAFTRAQFWPRWNGCFFWVGTRNLVQGKPLIWAFEPLKPMYLYKMPATANVIELSAPPVQSTKGDVGRVTWAVTALPGFFAHHTYYAEDLGDGRTRFGSWEKATGWNFRATKRFWIAHFEFVKDRSLEGARRLEDAYQREGRLDEDVLRRLSR